MNNKDVELLRSPGELDTLYLYEEGEGKQVNYKLIGKRTGKAFPIIEQIPVLLDQTSPEANQAGTRFYNAIAPIYDLLHKTQSLISGGEAQIRKAFLKELTIKPKDRVLEVCVGTGVNLPYLPKFGHYYGVDLSIEMLRRCRKRIQDQEINATVVMGDAQSLPFASGVFDTVFSVCAFRLFNDKARALKEMVRVAKPGATIMIVDQIRSGVPLKYLPPKMQNVNVKEVSAWALYCLVFQKTRVL